MYRLNEHTLSMVQLKPRIRFAIACIDIQAVSTGKMAPANKRRCVSRSFGALWICSKWIGKFW